MCVHVWQMYLRLSAWPSLSISPDRVLTAVQSPLSMCWQTVNPVEVLSDNPSCRSLLWILLICLSLYPPPPYFLFSLYLSSSSPRNPFFFSSSTACFTYQSHLLFNLPPLCHNPCPQHFTPSYPSVRNPPMHNPHISCSTNSSVPGYITSILCNPLSYFLKYLAWWRAKSCPTP